MPLITFARMRPGRGSRSAPPLTHRCGKLLALLVLLWPMALAAQKTDTTYLFNGDRVIGEMKDLKLGLLRIKTDYMNYVYVEWDQIQTVRTTKRWYVRLRSGAYFDGHLAPSPQLDHLYVVRGTDQFSAQLAILSGPEARERAEAYTRWLNAGAAHQRRRIFTPAHQRLRLPAPSGWLPAARWREATRDNLRLDQHARGRGQGDDRGERHDKT